MDWNIEDRVILVDDRHGVSDNNPLNHSEWACTGTIVDLTDEYNDQNFITVEWDNRTQNVYGKGDLELESTDGFHCKSIW